MKIKYLKFKNWILLSAMSLLGLSACHSNKEIAKSGDGKDTDVKPPFGDNRVTPMYGVPARDLKVEAIDDTIRPKVEAPQPREPQVTVYGVPTVDFAVKGRVVDSNGKPIKGLQVMLVNSEIDVDNLPDNQYWQEEMKRISDTTDANGDFNVRTSDRPWEKVRVMVRDIDGKKGGSFENQILDVEFGEPESGNRPMSSWKLGEKKAEVTVKMKRKK